jgi:hypothetical protein
MISTPSRGTELGSVSASAQHYTPDEREDAGEDEDAASKDGGLHFLPPGGSPLADADHANMRRFGARPPRRDRLEGFRFDPTDEVAFARLGAVDHDSWLELGWVEDPAVGRGDGPTPIAKPSQPHLGPIDEGRRAPHIGRDRVHRVSRCAPCEKDGDTGRGSADRDQQQAHESEKKNRSHVKDPLPCTYAERAPELPAEAPLGSRRNK